MKLLSFLLLLTGLIVGPARAQQSTQAAPQPSVAGRHVHRIMAPPKSATTQGAAARSTAQQMAAHPSQPLTQVPSFSVTGLDRKAVDISTVHSSGHWLLFYRAEHCLPCDKVMTALAKSESPLFKQGASYVIVVKKSGAAAASGMLDQIKSSYPTLANATWVEDAAGAGFAALQPHGEPVLYAVNDSDIAWAVHGTLSEPATLEKLAASWLASTSKPHPAASTAGKSRPIATAASASTRQAAALSSH